MNQSTWSIEPPERGMAAITHLSGLAGYIIPFGGAIVPIVIWIVNVTVGWVLDRVRG